MQVQYRELSRVLGEFLDGGDGPFHLLCPFISNGVMESILERHRVHTVYTSWRADHLLSGHASLDLYPLLKRHGTNLVICDRIHAKVFSNATYSRAMLGSANLTAKGMGTASGFNFEAVVVSASDSTEVRGLISAVMVTSTVVDDRVHDIFREWLARHAEDSVKIRDVSGPHIPAAAIGPWLLAHLPASDGPRELWEAVNIDRADDERTQHDVLLFGGGLVGTRRAAYASMRLSLSANPFFANILETVRLSHRGVHFGGMKEIIQKRCADIPAPHRRDLNDITRNLYRWIADLYPERFEIARPHYSEVIRSLSR